MLLPGTQMHIITFLFISIEVVILFYLIIYRLARPNDKAAGLNIILIFLLIFYNVTGGLLPDETLPGSYFLQMALAYATGFITPCYFPYYVHKAFALEKMKFHAFRGIFICLIFPYIIFLFVFAVTGSVENAKNIFIIPMVYALWVIYSLNNAVKYKYKNDFSSKESRQERAVLLLSLTPWVGLPVIDYFNMGQAVEATITNLGFLTLFTFQVNKHIKATRLEHQRLINSEQRLKNWNTALQTEVDKRTKELEKINEQQMNTFINLAHETKTPLTLITNYMDEYMTKNGNAEELYVVKNNLNKLSADIVNLFDLEKFKKGFAIYNHDQICDFGKVLTDSVALFNVYTAKKKIQIQTEVEDQIFVKADPLSVNRIINNLIENAIKFSPDKGTITISLKTENDKVLFSVKDAGIGIPARMQNKVFKPYFQIGSRKNNTQGMGLGLPIVKKVVEDLNGAININSSPEKIKGTEILVSLPYHDLLEPEEVSSIKVSDPLLEKDDNIEMEDFIQEGLRKTVMIVEDNKSMLLYLSKKLKDRYNVYPALNGKRALEKLSKSKVIPDLIISDVMMDKMDGYTFANILSKNDSYKHIPFIFLTAKSTRQDRFQGLRLGAVDFIQKPFNMVELLQKVESILTISANQRKAILANAYSMAIPLGNTLPENTEKNFDRNCDRYLLTVREKDIARLICEGQKYKAIGETLFISEKTVAKHVQHIFEKMKISNKIELINRLESSN